MAAAELSDVNTPSTSCCDRLDLTILANIKAIVPSIPESEHLYDELEHVTVLHFTSRLGPGSLSESLVDAAKMAIRNYIWSNYGLSIRKRDFFLNARIPPDGRACRIAFDSTFLEVMNSFQLPLKTKVLRVDAELSSIDV